MCVLVLFFGLRLKSVVSQVYFRLFPLQPVLPRCFPCIPVSFRSHMFPELSGLGAFQMELPFSSQVFSAAKRQKHLNPDFPKNKDALGIGIPPLKRQVNIAEKT